MIIVNYYHKALHLGCCSSPRSASDIRGYDIYVIIWKPLLGECLQCVKVPTNKVVKKAVAGVLTNSHYTEEMVGHEQQKTL